MVSERAGHFVSQLKGDLSYKAFVPKRLPPEPGIRFDLELVNLLSRADQAIGRLDGVIENIPNPNLFVLMYVKREAVLSSQIEGTQASLSDILEKEEDILGGGQDNDVKVTLNYISAMNYGLKRIEEFPLSLRFIKEVHRELLAGVRGAATEPGEFRRSQNWVGPNGCTLSGAVYVPPPVFEMNNALNDFEKYLHSGGGYPILVDTGLAHAQFETIHPFLDGNGRIGRLLINFLLCRKKIISKPVLYLSYYFKKYRSEYYDRLTGVRASGDWEGWLKFFLRGICETADNTVELSEKIVALRNKNSALAHKNWPRISSKAVKALDAMYLHPVFSLNRMSELCKISYNTAKSVVDKFIDIGLLAELSDKKRNKKYLFKEYVRLLNEGTELK